MAGGDDGGDTIYLSASTPMSVCVCIREEGSRCMLGVIQSRTARVCQGCVFAPYLFSNISFTDDRASGDERAALASALSNLKSSR